MKALLLLLLTALCSSAQVGLRSPAFVGQLRAGGSAAPTYLLQENFEGPGYQNTWTEAGAGTINETDTTSPSPLEGADSLRIAMVGQSGRTTNIWGTANADVWGYCLLNMVSIPSATRRVVSFMDSAGALVCTVQITSAGLLNITAGGSGVSTVDALSGGSTYHVWFHYVKGSGINAVGSVAFSADGTKPTSGNAFATTIIGTATTDADRICVGVTASSTVEFVIDKIRVDNESIGSNPP